ncbi:MAG TPA: HypC/HybG/HupF family hydrogenase formation chaperone [Terriglobales bacterium]|nr:HypC/HybG/HupF family hydrogenase formation chaperone [Terriglobales bacterium]
MCLAVPGRVVACQPQDGGRVGWVRFGPVTQPVRLDFVPEVAAGDYVLVHVGFAISRVDAEEAERTYRLLEAAGYLAEAAALGGQEPAVELAPDERVA